MRGEGGEPQMPNFPLRRGATPFFYKKLDIWGSPPSPYDYNTQFNKLYN